MIGHFVNNLNAAQADTVLTMPMAGGKFRLKGDPNGMRCLLEVAYVGDRSRCFFQHWPVLGTKEPLSALKENGVAYRYDALCLRFGEHRVNAAIRNRVLANRARRLLAQPAREEVTV